jgi:hypothetical protein
VGRRIALIFLDLGDRRRWLVSTMLRPLCPRESPGTHCTGGWVGPGPVWMCAKNLAPTGIRLYDLYNSLNVIRMIKSRRMRWAGHVARMGDSRGAYRVLVGRADGKRLFGSLRRILEDNYVRQKQKIRNI